MSETKLKLHLTISFIGVLLGVSAGITFLIFDNDLVVFWSFLSAAFSLMNFYLCYLEYKEKLEEYYNINILRSINGFAAICAIIFSGVLAWYIFEIFYYHLPTMPINESYPITAVWCFMAWKWSTMLAVCTSRQTKVMCNSGRPLLQT